MKRIDLQQLGLEMDLLPRLPSHTHFKCAHKNHHKKAPCALLAGGDARDPQQLGCSTICSPGRHSPALTELQPGGRSTRALHTPGAPHAGAGPGTGHPAGRLWPLAPCCAAGTARLRCSGPAGAAPAKVYAHMRFHSLAVGILKETALQERLGCGVEAQLGR
eukprot:704324-Pelagomonas_calceolata.AAC.1